MTGSTEHLSPKDLTCSVCARPIALETAKTDETGKAVHEECYVRKTISRFRTSRYAIPALDGRSEIDRAL